MMKNLLIACLIVFGLTSCSKDSLDQGIDPLISINKSEIMVKVTYISFSDQCENTCGGSSHEVVVALAHAKVDLYQGEQMQFDAVSIPVISTESDKDGIVFLKDIDPAVYTIWVDTPLGTKSRLVTTQLHKRSYIDFSF